MPSFVAMLIASLASWLVAAPVRAILGPVASTLTSLTVGTVAFFFARQFLSDLRGD